MGTIILLDWVEALVALTCVILIIGLSIYDLWAEQ